MELRDFLHTLKTRWIFIACCLLLGLFGSIAFLRFFAKPYNQASALLFVTRTAQGSREDYYTYDGFHAQQTAYHYVDTVVGLARHLGVDKAVRKSEQLVQVTREARVTQVTQETEVTEVTEITQEKVEEEMRTFVDELIALSDSLNEKGDAKISVQLVENKIEVEEVATNPAIVLLVGVLGGLGVGVLAASLKEYFR
jgi:capsular polysaccharide biosynthesis protein